uniref:LRRCT domain-containing protein n=1 Tax=Branchiostoma floridae TaxID=7739 RepID=C3Z8V4_BRAFL|eukprot:XP_002595042.1 hypothetical protein BRAFLDRAFT_99698 [Branchiostoma floridae]
MPMLVHLDLSKNRLRKFPWPSLRNMSVIYTLKLSKNRITQVEALVDFPQSLQFLYPELNRITTVPETFVSGLNPPQSIFFLRLWGNPFLCDCKIQWLSRLRRCVWAHRDEGCGDATPERAHRLLQPPSQSRPHCLFCATEVWLAARLRRTTVENRQHVDVCISRLRFCKFKTSFVSDTKQCANRTICHGSSCYDRAHSRHPRCHGLSVVILLMVRILKCTSHCRKQRRQASANNMAAALALQTVSAMRVPNMIFLDQSHENHGHQQEASSDRDDRSDRHSLPHVYEDINDGNIVTSARAMEASNSSQTGQERGSWTMNLVQVDTANACWRYGNCAGQAPNIKTIPENVAVKALIVCHNYIEELTFIPEMQKLCHLDLSYNRLKKFPWFSLRNVSHLTTLKLNNNEITKVDSFVEVHRCIRYLHLQSNRIATIPESFLDGFMPINPPKNTFFLHIWQNPLLCDCKIQWIARLRRCVWEHRDDGCVNAHFSRVKSCIFLHCNFHQNGVVAILDQGYFLNPPIRPLKGKLLLKCDSPLELHGKLLTNVTLPTCGSPSSSPTPRQALVITVGTRLLYSTDLKVYSTSNREVTTVSTPDASLAILWEEFIAFALGAVFGIIFVAIISLRPWYVLDNPRQGEEVEGAPRPMNGPTPRESRRRRRHEDQDGNNSIEMVEMRDGSPGNELQEGQSSTYAQLRTSQTSSLAIAEKKALTEADVDDNYECENRTEEEDDFVYGEEKEADTC